MAHENKPTAIIIDDMASMRSMARVMLGAVGCEIVGEAENGEIGLKLYLEKKPDLVLLDIEMPVKDGISTLKSLLIKNPKVNVVMMTTVSNMAVVESCIFAGAKDYIHKDKDPVTIKARLEEVVNSIFS